MSNYLKNKVCSTLSNLFNFSKNTPAIPPNSQISFPKTLKSHKTKTKIQRRKKNKNIYRLADWLAGCLSPSSRFFPFAPRRAVQRSNPSTSSPGRAVAIDGSPPRSPSLKSLLSPRRPPSPSTPHSLEPHRIHSQAGRSPRSHLGIQEPKNRNQSQPRFEFRATSYPDEVREFPRRARGGVQRRRASGGD